MGRAETSVERLSLVQNGKGSERKPKAGSTEEKLPMIQRRLRVVQWLSTTPALGVCTLCSREFRVPMSALRRTWDAQASLQEQFDRHKCEPDSSQAAARVTAGTLLRQVPDEEEEDEEEDDRKKEDDEDEDEDDGYSE
jgi:hypothetical protein